MCRYTHTDGHHRVCQWAAPVNAWQSDIHRLVNPTTWQEFTQTAEGRETERERGGNRKISELEMQVRALK